MSYFSQALTEAKLSLFLFRFLSLFISLSSLVQKTYAADCQNSDSVRWRSKQARQTEKQAGRHLKRREGRVGGGVCAGASLANLLLALSLSVSMLTFPFAFFFPSDTCALLQEQWKTENEEPAWEHGIPQQTEWTQDSPEDSSVSETDDLSSFIICLPSFLSLLTQPCPALPCPSVFVRPRGVGEEWESLLLFRLPAKSRVPPRQIVDKFYDMCPRGSHPARCL